MNTWLWTTAGRRARDSSGNLVPDSAYFPQGIKDVADYVHSKGLKFGMYACPTTKTCCGRPGSYNHETQDAQLIASWGIDFLKYDWCGVQSGEQGTVSDADLAKRYTTMRDALVATNRPVRVAGRRVPTAVPPTRAARLPVAAVRRLPTAAVSGREVLWRWAEPPPAARQAAAARRVPEAVRAVLFKRAAAAR